MTMRDDVRTAFDREQTALGDVGDARHRLMHAAMVNRDQAANRGLQWAAAVAAILIAAIVITTFALVKAGSHASVVPAATPSPRAQASPTPVTALLNVPDSTPIIVFHDAVYATQMDGITWDGRNVGVLPSLKGSYAPNPAENRFGDATSISDRNGKVIAQGVFGAKFFGGTWADDDMHVCQIVPYDYLGAAGAPATLQLMVPGQAPRNVVQVGHVYEQAAIWVGACSVLSDRAVVVQSAGQGVGTNQLWVVQLSTGKILWTRSYDLNGLPVQITASRDGRFIAEQHATAAGSTTVWTSTILGPDGSTVGTLAGAVVDFSWDATLALTNSATAGAPAELVRVSDGRLLWSGPQGAGRIVFSDRVEPNGSSMAVAVENPAYGTPGTAPIDLYILASDGHVVSELRRVSL